MAGMRAFTSTTMRRLQALDGHRTAMARTERVCERRLRRQVRALNLVLALWAAALALLWLWSRVSS
jgi:hypothetical protein